MEMEDSNIQFREKAVDERDEEETAQICLKTYYASRPTGMEQRL